MQPSPFIIDCDTGRDDALTLWLAMQTRMPLAGVVTSYGNTNLKQVTENTARVLSFVGGDTVPLFAGAEKPLKHHTLYAPVVLQRQKNIGNGLCNIDLPPSKRSLPEALSPKALADAIHTLAQKHGPLHYIIIGPATNFALIAQELGDELPKNVAQVTMMGGKFSDIWEADPTPDFNIASDPYAVQTIFQTGIPIRFLPVNATWPILVSLTDIQALIPTTPLAHMAKTIMEAHARHFAPDAVFRFHDPSILLAIQAPEGFKDRHLNIALDEHSNDFGRLIDPEREWFVRYTKQICKTANSSNIQFCVFSASLVFDLSDCRILLYVREPFQFRIPVSHMMEASHVRSLRPARPALCR